MAGDFSLDKDQYDMTSWMGRTQHFLAITNPQFLFVSHKALQDAKTKLSDFKEGKRLPGVTDSELWKAKTLCSAVLHPDTQEPVPTAFRVCAFVPANVPICTGMLMLPQTPFNVIFWQWVNQSYNAGFNYCNRNANSSLDNTKLAGAYVAATSISCGLALGLGRAVERASVGPGTAALLSKVVPYCAVAGANVFNLVSMRSAELATGIPIKDSEGKELGLSKAAGKSAIMQSALTRAALPAPVLLVPPLIMRSLDRAGLAGMKARPAAELGIIIASVWLALPAAIGLFPPECSIDVKKLEPEFQNLFDSNGRPIEQVYFNKGV